jgi:hypothetical protein
MISKQRLPACIAGICSVLLIGCRPSASNAETSLAQRFNAQRESRADTVAKAEAAPSAEFLAFLRLTAEAPLHDGALQPTRCAAAPSGEVYFANRRQSQLIRWFPGRGEPRPVQVDVFGGLRQPAALAWSGERLHVLDATRNRVVRVDPTTGAADYVVINAGQSPFTLAVLPDGGYLLGGERWESDAQVTLLARYDADGRLQATLLPRTVQLEGETDHFHAPVLLARGDDGDLWIAEPGSFRVSRISAQGAVLQTMGEAPRGYRAPAPVPTGALGFEQLDTWLSSWTPHVFIHTAGGLVFSTFETHHPARGYLTTVYSTTGATVAAGLFSEAVPMCGRGDRLYMVRTSGGRSTLREYRLASAARTRTGAGGASEAG